MSRPSSKPASRPSTTARPSTGTRPGTGAKPSTGTRPSAGAAASKGELQNFLNVPATGKPGTTPATRPGAGGAANDFLNNQGTRPNTGKLPSAGQRSGAEGKRPGTGERLSGSRPERIDNRGERTEQRSNRKDEVRNQFKDNHPEHEFWADHPNWANYRIEHPFGIATWAIASNFFPWNWNDASVYAYGENIYYQDDSVYYGDTAVATSEEYAEQAQTLADSAPAVDETGEWMSLGVFAITEDGESSGPPPTLFIQLVVNKQGIIGGTFENSATNESQPIEGMVDKNNQRTAWTIVDKSWPVMETGLASLTEDTASVLVHFEDGQTQQWLLVRLEQPQEAIAPN